MRLDPEVYRFLAREQWRTLMSLEMGMRNHEWTPKALIGPIANLRGKSADSSITTLLKYKLIAHSGQLYSGYKLTSCGYDYLALRTFVARGLIHGVGRRIGVGKESDIHVCENEDGELLIMKLHRLGRISFRNVKKTRDYLGKRSAKNWLYLSRLAATKEFALMKALHEAKFPVPKPIDQNRHVILMEYFEGVLLTEVKSLRDPLRVYGQLMSLIVRLGKAGVIHCDFNEFNLLVNDDEDICLIDFPQMVSVQHPNAQALFERDVQCVRHFFESRFHLDLPDYPRFEDVVVLPGLTRISFENASINEEIPNLIEGPEDSKTRLSLAKAFADPLRALPPESEDNDDAPRQKTERQSSTASSYAASASSDNDDDDDDDDDELPVKRIDVSQTMRIKKGAKPGKSRQTSSSTSKRHFKTKAQKSLREARYAIKDVI